MKLPALRQASALAEQGEFPGAQVLEFLEFLSSEVNKGITILREETEESLVDGDASERLATLNKLRMRKRSLEKHVQKELKDVQQLITAMKLREDKSVVETLTARMRELTKDIGGQLTHLVEDFGL